MKLSANLEVIVAFFQQKENEGFYGNIELTMVNGKLGHVREFKSIQDFEIAAEAWNKFSDSTRVELTNKFGRNTKFLEAKKKHNVTELKIPEKLTS